MRSCRGQEKDEEKGWMFHRVFHTLDSETGVLPVGLEGTGETPVSQ